MFDLLIILIAIAVIWSARDSLVRFIVIFAAVTYLVTATNVPFYIIDFMHAVGVPQAFVDLLESIFQWFRGIANRAS